MIIRKVKVTEYEYQAPINYVAGATEPDIQFQLTDYEIPSGATGRVYVGRSDGTFEYTVATISGNTVTVAPTSSMFSVKGAGAIQVTLYVGNEVVKNFAVPVYVHADLADDSAEAGSDVTGVFRAAEEQALADFAEDAEAKAAEVIESIPADYTELTDEVSELNERLDSEIADVKQDFSDTKSAINTDKFNPFYEKLKITTTGGASIRRFQITKGNSFIITNNTSGDIITSTRNTENGDAIETFATIARSSGLIVTPQYNAEYIRVYASQPGTVDVESLSTIQKNNELVSGALSVNNPLYEERCPIVKNGYVENGAVVMGYDNVVGTMARYCVIDEILHIEKGSYIRSSNNITFKIAYYDDNGAYVDSTDYISSVYFSEKKNARITFRLNNGNDRVTPKDIYANVVFILLLRDYAKKYELGFLGLGGEKGVKVSNLNSGECCSIRFANGKVMVVDSGLYENREWWMRALYNRGIRRIDYLVITHYHDDHVGALIGILTNASYMLDISEATVFCPYNLTEQQFNHFEGTPSDYNLYPAQQTLQSYFSENNCTVVNPTEGQVLKIEDAEIEFYNTDQSVYYTAESEWWSYNYNDVSLCFNLRIGNNVVNYPADLGPIGQRRFAGKMPKADILQAPHHGWDNGANNLIPAWINNVSPNMVISINGNEHLPNSSFPNASMMSPRSPMQSWCEATGVPNYPTNLNGNIDVFMDKYSYRLDGHYTRYIRNDKNWSFTDNSEHIEE